MREYRILSGRTSEDITQAVEEILKSPEGWVLQGGVSTVTPQVSHTEPYHFFQAVTREVVVRPSE